MSKETSAPVLRNRQRVLVMVVITAVLCTALGWFASRMVESPAEAAARAAPPPPSIITAPVSLKHLESTILTRARVIPGDTFTVQPTSATGRSIVTAPPPESGASIAQGDVILEVSGQPVIALAGDIPSYRDLSMGVVGRDVAQLQKNLQSLGFPNRDPAGTFGRSTETALDAFFTSMGYPAAATLQSSQVVFLPSFPARVTSVSVRVGSDITGPAMTLSTGKLTVVAAVNPDVAAQLQPGTRAKIYAEVTGDEAHGAIAAIQDSPPVAYGEVKVDGAAQRYVVVDPSESLNPKLTSQDVRLTIITSSSNGDVLVVPVSAVSAGADGATAVTVVAADASQRRVPVRTGLVGAGEVAVTPQIDNALSNGDRVIVGVRSASGTP